MSGQIPSSLLQGISLIENKTGDVRLIKELFNMSGISCNLRVVFAGDEAMAFLEQKGAHLKKPRPELILLDLNLPKTGARPLKNHKYVITLSDCFD